MKIKQKSSRWAHLQNKTRSVWKRYQDQTHTDSSEGDKDRAQQACEKGKDQDGNRAMWRPCIMLESKVRHILLLMAFSVSDYVNIAHPFSSTLVCVPLSVFVQVIAGSMFLKMEMFTTSSCPPHSSGIHALAQFYLKICCFPKTSGGTAPSASSSTQQEPTCYF